MNFTGKINALFLGLTLLLAGGCGNDNDDQVVPKPVSQNDNSCLLLDHTTLRGNIQFGTAYQYDSQRNLIKLDFSDNSGNVNAQPSYAVQTNANGKIVKSTGSINGVPSSIRTYEYNANGLLIKNSFFNSSGALQSFNTYEYNSTNQLVKRNNYNGQNELLEYFTYSYPAANMAKKVAFQIVNNDTLPAHGIHEYTFDNKKSISHFLGAIMDEYYLFGHNPLTLRVIIPQVDTLNFSYSYIYNAEDYPTQIISYREGKQEDISTYNYNCQ